MRFTASPAAARALSPASNRSTSTAKIHCSPSPQAAVCQRMAFRLVESSHATVKMTTSPNKPVNRPKLFSLFGRVQCKTVREDLFETVVLPARVAAKNYPGGGQHEFAQYLQTSPAWRTGCVVEIGDGAGQYPNLRSMFGNGAKQGGALGADRQTV